MKKFMLFLLTGLLFIAPVYGSDVCEPEYEVCYDETYEEDEYVDEVPDYTDESVEYSDESECSEDASVEFEDEYDEEYIESEVAYEEPAGEEPADEDPADEELTDEEYECDDLLTTEQAAEEAAYSDIPARTGARRFNTTYMVLGDRVHYTIDDEVYLYFYKNVSFKWTLDGNVIETGKDIDLLMTEPGQHEYQCIVSYMNGNKLYQDYYGFRIFCLSSVATFYDDGCTYSVDYGGSVTVTPSFFSSLPNLKYEWRENGEVIGNEAVLTLDNVVSSRTLEFTVSGANSSDTAIYHVDCHIPEKEYTYTDCGPITLKARDFPNAKYYWNGNAGGRTYKYSGSGPVTCRIVVNNIESKDIFYIDKIEHEYSWKTIRKPTVFNTGLKEGTCHCGHKTTKTIPKLYPFIRYSQDIVYLKPRETYAIKISLAEGDSVSIVKVTNPSVTTAYYYSSSGYITGRAGNGAGKQSSTVAVKTKAGKVKKYKIVIRK